MPPTKVRTKRKSTAVYKPADPLDKKFFGTIEDQARAFRLVMRHCIYPIIASTPMVGLGGGVYITATGSTWPEAVDNLCTTANLTETNHYHGVN